MLYIQEVKGREILESRGLPTIEVEVTLSNGVKVYSSSASGTSYGIEDNVEIRDKDMSRYHGYGVTRAVTNVNKTIAPRLYKKDPQDQFDIDELLADLDGTPNKAHLGSNTILSTSMAVAKAGAASRNQSLFEYLHYLYEKQYNHLFKSEGDTINLETVQNIEPMKKMAIPEPIFNMINGRESQKSKLDFQDFMVILKGIPNYCDKLRYASEIDHQIQKDLMGSDYEYTSLSNEGGFMPSLDSDTKALEIIMQAISKLETRLESSVYFGLDIAATGIYDHINRLYTVSQGKKKFTPEEMVEYLLKFAKDFPIIFFEDPLSADDYKHWVEFKHKVPNFIGVVGDDLFNGNMEKINQNRKEHWANAISIKPNQIGSVLDLLNVVITAQQQKLKIVFSHRSGETNDDFLADFSVAVGAEYFKSGAPRKGERVSKYNRLMKIEEELKILEKI
ncbi:hypothetical protein A2X44_00460 [candidate division CPR3 bacterium GWF2_35_18]|uniref:Enolase n=1 Tax=candidate division CPR3 bacterium GW2011_GWF2_35_18 TaxID=1618350 RepID=A0A0G0C273_UNCC3|nr:MAG: Enolase [candidate division CPR3 bacterium GW2011_GWF2_35_18]KKP86734.1 MAG: Enolase [candidate division CPR3 bacterium GW2011_GWE2_35_7]OGB63386.1 MAG: hypothetical protein A2X44_00460 [candidate division CPR3 bacterium GWF2_35_18]OGB64869.1 MAG: hypothetical protein A2250_05570 [candidate division CPR3 bacterium RIFOXYA2_FULL_35_13]OGB79455.1 MAG: hypothetical protein A2296_03010 [candidate division CPR3 bacterium RIFOXYB2_FULL_35_8]OGB80487.1 MAG: hypothetical protein A2011_00510 [c